MFAQGNIYSTLKASGIKGPVKTIEMISYSVDKTDKGKLIQDSCCANNEEYNANGNIVKSESRDIRGKLTNGRLFSYYDNGLIKSIAYIDKDRKETYREDFILDERGNYKEGSGYREGILHRNFRIPSQNEYGLWTRFDWYSLDGKLYRAEEFMYEGNKLIRTLWKVNDTIDRDEQKTYNQKGEHVYTKSTGSRPFFNFENKRRIDKYDDKGNVTQYSILDLSDQPIKVFRRIYQYGQ